MNNERRPLSDRVSDEIPPLDRDVVEYFLVKVHLPITKVPHNFQGNPGNFFQELYIRSMMDNYWLLEAYLAFPDLIKKHDWAEDRVFRCYAAVERGQKL